jgi:hypothetical protein
LRFFWKNFRVQKICGILEHVLHGILISVAACFSSANLIGGLEVVLLELVDELVIEHHFLLVSPPPRHWLAGY